MPLLARDRRPWGKGCQIVSEPGAVATGSGGAFEKSGGFLDPVATAPGSDTTHKGLDGNVEPGDHRQHSIDFHATSLLRSSDRRDTNADFHRYFLPWALLQKSTSCVREAD